MEWTDSEHVYSVSGDPTDIAQAYVDVLSLGDWDSCRYIVGKEPRLSYGAKSSQECDALEEYSIQVQSILGVRPSDIAQAAAPVIPSQTITYVVNTNTRKFHCPDCKSVKQIKGKNRKDYSGSRDALIAQGYVPCKNCNP